MQEQLNSLNQSLARRAELRAEAQAQLAKETAERARQDRINAEKKKSVKTVRIEILGSVAGAGFSFDAGDIVDVPKPIAEELIAIGRAERSTAPLRIVVDQREFKSLQQRKRERLEQRQHFQLPSDAAP